MSERGCELKTERIAVFCPAGSWHDARDVLLKNGATPTDFRRTILSDGRGGAIAGVNIHLEGVPDKIRALIVEEVGIEPTIFPVRDKFF